MTSTSAPIVDGFSTGRGTRRKNPLRPSAKQEKRIWKWGNRSRPIASILSPTLKTELKHSYRTRFVGLLDPI